MKKSDIADILLEDLCRRETGPLTQEEIAEYIGYTRERISQIEGDALEKIRQALSEHLRSTCNFDILPTLDES